MKFNCEIGGRRWVVDAPERLVDGQRFPLSVDEESYQATYMRERALLILHDRQGLERHIQLRQTQVTRLAGDSEVQVASELISRGWRQYVQATVQVALPAGSQRDQSGPKPQVVRSQITGKVLSVLVEVGQAVSPGQALVVIEAMKMENRICSQVAGTVSHIGIRPGDAVQTGKELLRMTP